MATYAVEFGNGEELVLEVSVEAGNVAQAFVKAFAQTKLFDHEAFIIVGDAEFCSYAGIFYKRDEYGDFVEDHE